MTKVEIVTRLNAIQEGSIQDLQEGFVSFQKYCIENEIEKEDDDIDWSYVARLAIDLDRFFNLKQDIKDLINRIN